MAERLVEFLSGTIRVTARGEWLHGGEPMLPRVVELFSRHIVTDAQGHYAIRLGFQTAPIEVDDTAYFVKSLRMRELSDGALAAVDILVSDGRWETLRPDTLMQSEENVLYCRVLRGEYRVPCRFPPSLYHELGMLMELIDDRATLTVDGQAYSVTSYEAYPLAAA